MLNVGSIRKKKNNLDQYFVLDIRHTIYGSIIGMLLCVNLFTI